MNKLNDPFLPDDYEKAKTEGNNIAFYNNVTQCVLHFNNGKNEVISNNGTHRLMAVNIVTYTKPELSFVESVLKHYKDAVSIDDLSRRCGFKSAKTFTRHFKRKFNITPKQWLLLIKKNEVIHYLQNTDLPLHKIASIAGFSNMSHLHGFCMGKIGSTPAKIRKKAGKIPSAAKTSPSSNNA